MAYRIFVVDDDRHYARLISYRLERDQRYTVSVFNSGEDALAHLGEQPHLVLLDIMMPGIGGIETLRRVREALPDTQVVMVSAQGVIETAVEAMKLGAYDYVTKGQDDLVKLDAIVGHVVERAALQQEVETLRSEVQRKYSLQGLVGDSPAMQGVYRLVEKALRGDLTVSILGESGTGKELIARAIHYGSARRRGPFVVVNCAAIPRDLMESEFFGHEKGAFTGAVARKAGKFEQADGGTLFLDEIGELDLDLQAKLLRALQGREVVRVGGSDTISFDCRVISATNKDVVAMIRAGLFREDLYYRLFQFPIPLPPLRERADDLLLLADHILREYTSAHPEFKGKRLAPSARRAVLDYRWPGNVRELKSAIERAVLISDHDEIQPADLMLGEQTVISPWAQRFSLADAGVNVAPTPVPQPPPLAAPVYTPPAPPVYTPPAAPLPVFAPPTPAPPGPSGGDEDDEDEDDVPLGDYERSGEIVSLEDLKQQAVLRAYRLCDGNVDRAAVELGIGRATMYRMLKKYGIMR